MSKRGLLIDTSIISLFSPDRKRDPSDEGKSWFHQQGAADKLYISAITVAEIERGLRNLARRGGVERAERLGLWLDALIASFSHRVLSVDAVVGRVAGAIEDAATARGVHPWMGDVFIAATAKAYDLTVVTANVRHFEPLGVAVDFPECFRLAE